MQKHTNVKNKIKLKQAFLQPITGFVFSHKFCIAFRATATLVPFGAIYKRESE